MTPRSLARSFSFAFFALAGTFAGSVYAAAVLQTVTGDVRTGMGSATPAPATQSARVEPGTRVITGAGSQAILRFDDGQQVVLNENTDFRVVDFRYNQAQPANDRSVFDLLKGALRVVSGLIGQRNASAFQLRAPQATIGIRGTDFMVALVNPMYVSVLQGTVAATNAAGTVAFGAGAIGSVATATTLAVAIPASALPAAASAAFGNLSAAAVGAAAGGAATGATGTGAAATGAAGAGVGTAVAVGAAAAAAAAITGGTSTTQHTTTTTTHH